MALERVIAADNASVSGNDFEDEIEAGFAGLGLELIQANQWREARLYENLELRIVVKDAPYDTIYGHRARIEFLIILGAERQILVEVKRQKVSGSADEKLPYVFSNAVKNIPDREFVLVLDGDGWKPEAKTWVKKQADNTEGFYVLDPKSFLEWLETRL